MVVLDVIIDVVKKYTTCSHEEVNSDFVRLLHFISESGQTRYTHIDSTVVWGSKRM